MQCEESVGSVRRVCGQCEESVGSVRRVWVV